MFVILLHYAADYFKSCTSKQSKSVRFFSPQLIEYFQKHLGGEETCCKSLLSAELCLCARGVQRGGAVYTKVLQRNQVTQVSRTVTFINN